MGGCLGLILLFFCWLFVSSVAGATLGCSTEEGMIIGALFVIVTGVIVLKKSVNEEIEKKKIESKAKTEMDSILGNMPNFSVDESYIINNNLAFIAVDENKRKIAIGGLENDTGKVNYKIINAKDIMGVEITENGKGLLSSSVNKNTLGMAAVGGLLFGGAGAIVGAISGSNAKSKITEISLRIAIDNIKTPYVGINFLSQVTGKGSDEHKQVLTNAEKWYGIISILLERESRKSNNNNIKQAEGQSSDDFIEDAKKLINDEKYKDAIKVLSMAINENYKSSLAHYVRAVAYSKISEKQKTIDDLRKAADLGNSQAINYLQKLRKDNT